jgi:hypothetical protein
VTAPLPKGLLKMPPLGVTIAPPGPVADLYTWIKRGAPGK